MKNYRLLIGTVLLPCLIILINSCSSTHDFAGTYPKNNITGKGFGGHATYNDVPSEKVNSTVTNTTAARRNRIIPAPDSTLMAQQATGEKLTPGEKFGMKLNAFLLKQAGVNDIKNFSAPQYFAEHKGLFSWKEKLGNKLYAKVYNKYMAHESAADMGGASGPLGIVSLVFGIVALVSWYGAFLFGLVAIITGALSLAGGARRPIMAILGIIFGILAIIGWGVVIGIHVVIFKDIAGFHVS